MSTCLHFELTGCVGSQMAFLFEDDLNSFDSNVFVTYMRTVVCSRYGHAFMN